MKENDMMTKSPGPDTSRPSSPAEEAASSGGRSSSTSSSPASTSPVSEGRLSPKILSQEETVRLRDVSGFDPKHHSMFQHHHSHHTNLTTPPYFPYYPANAMIQGPSGGPPLFVQTSFGMVPASHHQRSVSLQRQHPSANAGVIAGTPPHSHIPGHGGSRLQGQQSPASQHSAGVSSPRSSASDCPTIQSLNSRDSNPSHQPNHHEYHHNPHQPNTVHPQRDVKRESAFASAHQSGMAIQSVDENDRHSNGQSFIQRTNDTNSTDIENTENNRKDTDTNNYDDDDILVDVENVNSPLGSTVESDEEGEEGCPSESGDARSTCSSSRDLHGGSEPNEKKGTQVFLIISETKPFHIKPYTFCY